MRNQMFKLSVKNLAAYALLGMVSFGAVSCTSCFDKKEPIENPETPEVPEETVQPEDSAIIDTVEVEVPAEETAELKKSAEKAEEIVEPKEK